MIASCGTKNDLGIYEREAASWWDGGNSAFRSLQRVTAFRLREIEARYPDRLSGARIADLGCGGGLIAVPLAARGARVCGIDRSGRSVRAARAAAVRAGVESRCRFAVGDVCSTPFAPSSCDFAFLADVVEHVNDPGAALREAGRVLEPGGTLFVSTLNRTLRSRVLGVFLAEALGYVPKGTHDARLFLRPVELCSLAAAAGFRCDEVMGEALRFFATLRAGALELRRGAGTALSYSAFFTKTAPATSRGASA